MAEESGFANYSFLIQVATDNYDLVHDFGYKREEEFVRNMRGRLLKCVADYPDILMISVNRVNAGYEDEEIEDTVELGDEDVREEQ
jgi:hypothetical protein